MCEFARRNDVNGRRCPARDKEPLPQRGNDHEDQSEVDGAHIHSFPITGEPLAPAVRVRNRYQIEPKLGQESISVKPRVPMPHRTRHPSSPVSAICSFRLSRAVW